MQNEASRPSRWRVAAAFVFAPAIAALAFCVLNPMYPPSADFASEIWKAVPLVTVVGGYVPALVFGLPAYLILQTRLRPTVLSCAIVGAVVAALPWALLAFLPGAEEASVDGRQMVVHGRLTWFGFYEGAKLVGSVGLFGGLGGFAFWLIAAAGHRSARLSREF
jgi:hypothetical protein